MTPILVRGEVGNPEEPVTRSSPVHLDVPRATGPNDFSLLPLWNEMENTVATAVEGVKLPKRVAPK